jgi:hypothetical protein
MDRFTARLSVLLCLVGVIVAGARVRGAQELTFDQLATCKVSWLEAKDDPTRLQPLGDALDADFTKKQGEPFFVPKKKMTVLGLPLLRLFPENVGMALGFSVMVSADFETAKKALETAAGVALTDCQNGEGVRTCGHQLAEKKTLMMMAPASGTPKETLFGCYYYYEK